MAADYFREEQEPGLEGAHKKIIGRRCSFHLPVFSGIIECLVCGQVCALKEILLIPE